MASEEPFFHWHKQDLFFNAKIQPRASSDNWIADAASGIRIRITSAPTDGKANQHLQAYLAKLFGVNKSAVTLLSGQRNRNKRLKVRNPSQVPEIFSK